MAENISPKRNRNSGVIISNIFSSEKSENYNSLEKILSVVLPQNASNAECEES